MVSEKWVLRYPIGIVWTKEENAIKDKAKSISDHLIPTLFICLCICIFTFAIWYFILLCFNTKNQFISRVGFIHTNMALGEGFLLAWDSKPFFKVCSLRWYCFNVCDATACHPLTSFILPSHPTIFHVNNCSFAFFLSQPYLTKLLNLFEQDLETYTFHLTIVALAHVFNTQTCVQTIDAKVHGQSNSATFSWTCTNYSRMQQPMTSMNSKIILCWYPRSKH